jgi:hypothetical protein
MGKINVVLGRTVDGLANPNWKGGPIPKICEICGIAYIVKRPHAKSRFCSLQCVGISQRGRSKASSRRTLKPCDVCGNEFSIPLSHMTRRRSCSEICSGELRSRLTTGGANPNWCGGLSRLPYPWDFTKVTSKAIKQRDGFTCQNPGCSGTDPRLTAHHINYQKQDCRPENLITLCSACNSKANFDRDRWQRFYAEIIALKPKKGGGYEVEQF